ncbi:MAG: hypothetical protein MJ095_08325, partial [Oscillospiraceae bacterium]|nr:hypothetical protein [Oscillospiraceae bacterium]
PSTDPSVNPSTPADPFEEGKEVEDSIYDILTKSAKYLAKAEYSVIDFETDETVVNNGISYKNEAKGQAVRSGKNVKATVENGKFTYNDGTEDVFDYSGAKAYAFYNGNGEADVYANATLVNGKDNTLPAEWLYKKASKSIADDTAALKNDANTVYNNVLKELIDKKVKELGENLTLERLNEIQNEVKATEAEADKVKADFEEKANALQTRADKLKADADALQARVDALQAQIDKADANTDTEALENEKASISADRDRFTAEKESLLKDKKDLEDQAEAKKKEFEAKRDSILEELGGASLEETKAKVEKLQKEKEAFENFQKNAVEQAKAQFDITAPSKTYLQDMLKGDNSAKNRINNNSKVVEVPGTENQIKIVTDAAAIADTKGEFMETPTGKVQYIVEKNKLADGTFEYVPVKIEVLEGSTVKSTDKNSVTATVKKTVIDFKFPTTTEVKFTDKEKAEIAKSTTDPFEFIKKDKFTEFVAKFAENKANVK